MIDQQTNSSDQRNYTTLMVEILKDNARRDAGEVYGAMDMDRPSSWVRSGAHVRKTVGGYLGFAGQWRTRSEEL